jgi:mannose-6-phosphate isomerase-like protein (cupin superfamily)
LQPADSRWRLGASDDGELLSFDLYLRPGAVAAAEHRHVRQKERFRVHAGVIALEVAAERRDVGLKEEVAVPAGVPHRWWNEGRATARLARAR